MNEVGGAGNFVVGFKLHGNEKKKYTEEYGAEEAVITREGRTGERVKISWQRSFSARPLFFCFLFFVEFSLCFQIIRKNQNLQNFHF